MPIQQDTVASPYSTSPLLLYFTYRGQGKRQRRFIGHRALTVYRGQYQYLLEWASTLKSRLTIMGKHDMVDETLHTSTREEDHKAPLDAHVFVSALWCSTFLLAVTKTVLPMTTQQPSAISSYLSYMTRVLSPALRPEKVKHASYLGAVGLDVVLMVQNFRQP